MARRRLGPARFVVKRYGIGLLLAGMALIVGSCVPLAQLALSGAGPAPQPPLALSPWGDPATLQLAEPVTAAPVVVLVAEPGVARRDTVVPYTLEIKSASGPTVLRESGTIRFDSARDAAGSLAIRLDETTLPAGNWQVRFDAGRAAPAVRSAALRLARSGPGLIPGLLTALTLAILGWLAACLGALQWVRVEAAAPLGTTSTASPADRPWIVACHLSALLGYILPLGHLLGPIAVWLAKRDSHPGVDRAGRIVLNFQLSATLYVLAALFLSFFLIGLVILFLLVVFHFTVVLTAALRAQRGEEPRYPLSIRFIQPGS